MAQLPRCLGTPAPRAAEQTRAAAGGRAGVAASGPAWASQILSAPAPRPPLLPPPAARTRRPRLSLTWQPDWRPGSYLWEHQRPGRASRGGAPFLGFSVADEVLEECAARKQAGRHELQQQG